MPTGTMPIAPVTVDIASKICNKVDSTKQHHNEGNFQVYKNFLNFESLKVFIMLMNINRRGRLFLG